MTTLPKPRRGHPGKFEGRRAHRRGSPPPCRAGRDAYPWSCLAVTESASHGTAGGPLSTRPRRRPRRPSPRTRTQGLYSTTSSGRASHRRRRTPWSLPRRARRFTTRTTTRTIGCPRRCTRCRWRYRGGCRRRAGKRPRRLELLLQNPQLSRGARRSRARAQPSRSSPRTSSGSSGSGLIHGGPRRMRPSDTSRIRAPGYPSGPTRPPPRAAATSREPPSAV